MHVQPRCPRTDSGRDKGGYTPLASARTYYAIMPKKAAGGSERKRELLMEMLGAFQEVHQVGGREPLESR